MPITKIDVPEVPSLYALRFDRHVGYDDLSSLQKYLGEAKKQQKRYLAFDMQQAISIDPLLLELLVRSCILVAERRQRLYFLHDDKYMVWQFFTGTSLAPRTRKKLLIRPDLETLLKELQ
ncbi:hypothetical protein HYS50_01350 [Candidatus Woesearchaeota archaeon]|nr:hypothetical protein [Candidatus Woesearchaeota archaeon]